MQLSLSARVKDTATGMVDDDDDDDDKGDDKYSTKTTGVLVNMICMCVAVTTTVLATVELQRTILTGFVIFFVL